MDEDIERVLQEMNDEIDKMSTKHDALLSLKSEIDASDAFTTTEKDQLTQKILAFEESKNTKTLRFREQYTLYETKVKKVDTLLKDRRNVIDRHVASHPNIDCSDIMKYSRRISSH